MNTTGSAGAMTPAQFIAKWSPVALSERAASQEHMIDPVRLLGQPTPARGLHKAWRIAAVWHQPWTDNP